MMDVAIAKAQTSPGPDQDRIAEMAETSVRESLALRGMSEH